MPVDVLVEQVAEPARPAGVAGLRAERPQPHEVALLHLDPVLVEQVDGLALEDVEPVLHDVRLGERDHPAGLEVDDVDVHVVAHVERVDEPLVLQRPSVPGICARLDVGLVGDERLAARRCRRPARRPCGSSGSAPRRRRVVAQRPVGARREEGVAARAQLVATRRR